MSQHTAQAPAGAFVRSLVFAMPPKNKLQDHSADNVGPTREKTLNQLIAKSDEALKFKVETVSDETSTEGTNSNRISEHMPHLAKIMDKCVPLRAVYGSPNGSHDSYICYTGRQKPGEPTGGWPSVGACVSKVLGPTFKSMLREQYGLVALQVIYLLWENQYLRIGKS